MFLHETTVGVGGVQADGWSMCGARTYVSVVVRVLPALVISRGCCALSLPPCSLFAVNCNVQTTALESLDAVEVDDARHHLCAIEKERERKKTPRS
jgi:hypothetical protein